MSNYRVREDFAISSNKNLSSLEGLPEYIGGDLLLANSNLTSLKGVENTHVEYDLLISRNRNLGRMDYYPKYVGGSLYCNTCGFKDFKGFPETINGNLYCSDMFESLEGFPNLIKGFLFFHLSSLEGYTPYEYDDDPERYWTDFFEPIKNKVQGRIVVG